MDEEFYKERAKQVRDMAAKADPFIKKRLLDLATKYERHAPRRPTPLPAVPIKDPDLDQGKDFNAD